MTYYMCFGLYLTLCATNCTALLYGTKQEQGSVQAKKTQSFLAQQQMEKVNTTENMFIFFI